MTPGRDSDYFAGLVRELCKLPHETEWVEFKVDNSDSTSHRRIYLGVGQRSRTARQNLFLSGLGRRGRDARHCRYELLAVYEQKGQRAAGDLAATEIESADRLPFPQNRDRRAGRRATGDRPRSAAPGSLRRR